MKKKIILISAIVAALLLTVGIITISMLSSQVSSPQDPVSSQTSSGSGISQSASSQGPSSDGGSSGQIPTTSSDTGASTGSGTISGSGQTTPSGSSSSGSSQSGSGSGSSSGSGQTGSGSNSSSGSGQTGSGSSSSSGSGQTGSGSSTSSGSGQTGSGSSSSSGSGSTDQGSTGTDFDSSNIVLTFAAITDTHFTADENSLSEQKFIKAMNIIKQKTAANGLDAVLITGDLTDNGRAAEIARMTAAFNSSVPGETVLMYTPGNHEQRTSGYQQAIIDALGQSYFTADAASSRPSEGYRHCIVNGYHFFFLDPVDGYPSAGTVYPSEMKEWLEADLAAAAAADPDKQIFVCSHPPVYNTVYGSTIGGNFYTKDLTSILEKYPQVVYFSGHSHYPINDERSIWQGKFTAVNLSALYYTSNMGGDFLEINKTNSYLTDAYDYSAGTIVEIDANGNMRITRLDFANNVQIKAPWLIPSVKADGSHLKAYTSDRWNENEAPVFASAVKYEYIIKDLTELTITFDQATDDDMLHHYKIRLYEDNNSFASINVKSISGFYRNGDLSTLPARHTATVSGLKPDTDYTVEIMPVDSCNSSGNAISFKISTKGE